jgi:hypothetical protein
MEVSSQLHAPFALILPKEPPGGLQSLSGRGGENIPDPAGNPNPVVQPVAWSLYGLNYTISTYCSDSDIKHLTIYWVSNLQ